MTAHNVVISAVSLHVSIIHDRSLSLTTINTKSVVLDQSLLSHFTTISTSLYDITNAEIAVNVVIIAGQL
jgi:hypothetical protein